MRKVVTYIAWDDTEFETEEECKNYEQYALDMMVELCHCYEFYNNNNEQMETFVPNFIEDMMILFEKAASVCDVVKVNRIPQSSADAFQNNQFGFYFPDATGTFKWNNRACEWEKIAD